MKSCTFQSKPENERNPPAENFLYFRKRKPRKNLFCFRKWKPQKLLTFQKVTFRTRKVKRFLYFGK